MRHVRNALAFVPLVLALGCSGNRSGGAGAGSGGASIGPGEGASGGANASGGSGGSAQAGASGALGGSAGVGALSEPIFRDGTRLVAQSYLATGAAPLFVGVYDRQEQLACEFRVTTDGKLRCVPPLVPPPLPLERWQEGTEVMGASTGLRLRRVFIVTPDGGAFPSWVSGELGDETYWKACQPDTTRELDGTGEGACLPAHASFTGLLFEDAACTQSLAQGLQKGVMPLMIATPKRELFAVGAAFAGPTFIQYGPGGTCSAFMDGTVPAAYDYYRIGQPLPASAAATVRVVPRGTGRLAVRTVEFEGVALTHVRHRTDSGPHPHDGPYLDRDRGTSCRPTWTAGGELRCVPADAHYVPETWLTNFADPDCTQPVVNSKAEAAVLLQSDSTQGRQVVTGVRKVAAESTQTAYSRANNTAGECRAYPKGAGYPLGDVIPLDSFATVELRTGSP